MQSSNMKRYAQHVLLSLQDLVSKSGLYRLNTAATHLQEGQTVGICEACWRRIVQSDLVGCHK